MEKIDKILIAFFIVIIISSYIGVTRYFNKIDKQINDINQQKEMLDQEYEELHKQVENLLSEEVVWEGSF